MNDEILVLYHNNTVIWTGLQEDCPYVCTAYEEFDLVYEPISKTLTSMATLKGGIEDGLKASGECSEEEKSNKCKNEENYNYNHIPPTELDGT